MHGIHRTPCREEPPTDDTDVHRCRRVWHSCHTHAAKFCEFREFCGRTAHPKHLCKSVKSVGGKRFPQNARNSQKLLAENSLPQMSTDVHRCRRVWHPCHTHAAKFCVFCEFCGRTAHHKYLCKSVKSVGGHLSRRFCVFCEFRGRTAHPKYLCKSVKSVGGHLSRRFCEFGVFRGRISHSRRRGYGKMPYPPKEESVGGHLIKL